MVFVMVIVLNPGLVYLYCITYITIMVFMLNPGKNCNGVVAWKALRRSNAMPLYGRVAGIAEELRVYGWIISSDVNSKCGL